jgi:hypothetical protein
MDIWSDLEIETTSRYLCWNTHRGPPSLNIDTATEGLAEIDNSTDKPLKTTDDN